MSESVSTPNTRPTAKRLRGVILQSTVTLVCLAAAFHLVPVNSLLRAIQRADWFAIALASLMIPLAVSLRAWRWHFLLRRKNVDVTMGTMMRATLTGYALNLLLPASLGDVARGYFAGKAVGNQEAAFATAIVDKVVALFTLCAIGLACALYLRLYSLSGLLFAVVLVLGGLFVSPRLVPWELLGELAKKIGVRVNLKQLRSALHLDGAGAAGAILISVLGWLTTNLVYFFAWRAFDPTTPLLYTFAIAPIINVIRIVPVSISGLGSADLFIVYSLATVGMAESDALAGSLVVNLLLIISPGIVGALVAFRKDRANISRLPG